MPMGFLLEGTTMLVGKQTAFLASGLVLVAARVVACFTL
jgi:hypothetical protein